MRKKNTLKKVYTTFKKVKIISEFLLIIVKIFKNNSSIKNKTETDVKFNIK